MYLIEEGETGERSQDTTERQGHKNDQVIEMIGDKRKGKGNGRVAVA